MTLLNYLQNHSLEEILENDKMVKFLWSLFIGDVYDHCLVIPIGGHHRDDGALNVGVCYRHECKFLYEDTEDENECTAGLSNLECPYKDEHWKEFQNDVKNELLKELEDV